MSIRSLSLPLLSALALTLGARADDRWAPNAAAGPVDQLVVSGNACGPAALLAAIRCGDDNWQAIAGKIPGTSDRSKLLYIIKAHGLRPSATLRDRNRWSRHGVNAEDLTAIAGELAGIGGLPAPRSESLLAPPRESPEKLLRRTHKRLRDSLKRGLPPVLSLRRFALRNGQWTAVDSHFVTIVRVPEKLGRRDSSFPCTYFEPWGGKKQTATFRIPAYPLLSPGTEKPAALELLAPKANVGQAKVRNGERTALVPSMVIGRW